MAQKFGSFQGTNNVMYLNHSGSVSTGDIWFDHGNSAIKIYNGTSWDEVGSGSGGGGVSYSVSTSNVTATANQGIIADTSGGSFTVTLPASPSTGDKVFIADGADFATNNLTVARNGSTIEGASEDFILDVGGPNVGFIYDGTTWQVYPQSGLMSIRGIEDNSTSTAITINSSQDVSFSGNVTLGYVDGDFYVTDSSTTNGYVQIGEKYIYGLDNVGGGSFNIQSNGASYFTGGNLGIGTTSPTAYTGQTNLNINSGGVSRIDFDISDSLQGYALAESGYLGLIANTSNYLMLGAGNLERMRISSAGDVQIGTAAVTGGRYFDIYNTGSTATDFAITRYITQQVGSSSTTSADIFKRKNGQFGISNNDTHADAHINFTVGASERMRIDSSGNVMVGQTSAYAGTGTTIGPNGELSNATASGVASSLNLAGIIGVSNGLQITTNTSNQHEYTFLNGSSVAAKIDTSGNVGIGTSSPVDKLHVYSGAAGGSAHSYSQLVVENSTHNAIQLLSPDSSEQALWFGDASSSTAGGVTYYHPDNIMTFRSNGSERMRITSTGGVGIGTTSVTNKLEVDGGSSPVFARISTTNAGGKVAGLILANSGKTAFNDGVKISHGGGYTTFDDLAGTTNFAINQTNGYVGVNSTAPSYRFEVAGTNEGILGHLKATDSTQAYMMFSNSTTGSGKFADGSIVGLDSDESAVFWNFEATPMRFGTSGTERMRIDSSGNLALGTTTASTGIDTGITRMRVVAPNSNYGVAATFVADSVGRGMIISNQSGSEYLYFGTDILGAATNNPLKFITYATERMRLATNGDLHVDGDVIAYSTTISDQRLKDNVETIDKALDKVTSLRGVTYTWNTGSREGKSDLGVIAQEVEAIIPEIVHDKEMALVDGETYKTVDYEKLTALLIEAIKELKAEVDELKASK